ncbi:MULTISPECIES: CBS domain-containing protein [unclassified Caballeronia]|uniref:CBS domain-containing protein n=1 Tax=unclassified Caballeronia TaxID=2646786 RepID=UPI00285CFC57|nr:MULTISPECIES: CBS domain-containing protein [unclassified Caballeronia]MDR5752840.1 CBS domain-containing protein [Caballeronia sp. LZ024]MDR5841484.1 CBS domain-containing protein [Caballeronia sp. LZ031]
MTTLSNTNPHRAHRRLAGRLSVAGIAGAAVMLVVCVAVLLVLHAIGPAFHIDVGEVRPFTLRDENGLKLMLAAASAYWMLARVCRNPGARQERTGIDNRSDDKPSNVVSMNMIRSHSRTIESTTKDLESIMAATRAVASARMLRECTCEQIMTRNVVTVSLDTRRRVVEKILERHRIRALPAVHADGRLAGIVTRGDLEKLGRPSLVVSDGMRVGRPRPASQTVAGLMTRQVDAIDATSSLETLLGLYVKKGHHHIPVVDAQRRIVGIVTTSDLAERFGWLPVAENSRRG